MNKPAIKVPKRKALPQGTYKKDNNDAGLFNIKVTLRVNSLPDKKDIKVLDAYGGEGKLWDAVRRACPDKNITTLGIDKNQYKKVQLQGDNLKFLMGLDLGEYDIIDLDAWGSPTKQLSTIIGREYHGIIHCTFIQTGYGGLGKEMLTRLGYPPEMVRKCPSLFNRNGFKKFLEYLALEGVKEVSYYSSARGRSQKNYLYFTL